MAWIVPKEQWGALADKISGWCLGSLAYKVLGSISAERDVSVRQREFWVDRWPECTTVLEVPSSNALVYLRNVYSFVSSNQEGLRSLLYHPDLIKWTDTSSVIIGAAIVSHSGTIKEVAHSKGFQEDEDNVLCYVMEATKHSLQPFDLHPGYTLDRLKMSDAELINSNWPYSDSCASLKYIEHLLDNYPGTAVRDGDGILVAYGLIQFYGAIGMLWVDPKHRRKGLAAVVLSHLAEQMLDAGRPAFSYVEHDNPISLGLHAKCGFTSVDNHSVQWLNFVSKETPHPHTKETPHPHKQTPEKCKCCV